MRILLGQLAPAKGDVAGNLTRVESLVRATPCDLAVFPELFLSGYRVGDRVHALALARGDPAWERLGALAQSTGRGVVVGAPLRHATRPGETENAALVASPDGSVHAQVKRFLPTYGPFEEGSFFSPTTESDPIASGGIRLGVSICYDAFFPEVGRALALAGAEVLVVISASPVTSRRLFERVLPARAIENALPVVYVNRVGVEDGIVFGGGSAAWDPRGEPLVPAATPFPRREAEESVGVVTVDPTEARRWRPFRPVLRDLGRGSAPTEPRPGAPGSVPPPRGAVNSRSPTDSL
jgi:predicted amidohydrolase